jgi:aryl-alcohol dehydrogenase-like predicted oxidoreductase
MEYCNFGRSGLRVSRLILGAMTFGSGSGIWKEVAGVDNGTTSRLVAYAVEKGVNFIDTADAYSQGQSELTVGAALKELKLDETQLLVGTKVRLRTGPGQNEVGLGRSHIMRSVERSLRNLDRDHIDLLQLHDRDLLVPLDETLRVLDDLVTQGKVRHIGVCNFSAAELERAHSITKHAHWTSITSNQVYYSLAARDIEHEIAPIAKQHSIALVAWSPLSGGYLSGKYTPGMDKIGSGRRSNLNFPPIDPAHADPIVLELRRVAEQLDSTPAQVALAWVLGRQEIAAITMGARTQAQLANNLDSAQLVLPPELRSALDKVSQRNAPYPYWMQSFHDKDRVAQ